MTPGQSDFNDDFDADEMTELADAYRDDDSDWRNGSNSLRRELENAIDRADIEKDELP